ncbi:MAG: amidohydrolase family protein [Janthinobacterium lividum]
MDRTLKALRCALLALCGLGYAVQITAQTSAVQADIDPELARYIASVAAIDNHAHTVLPPPNDKTDRDFDALPVDSMAPQTDPVALRDSNPRLADAWQALWGFNGKPPLASDALAKLQAARTSIKRREGANYDTWLLNRVNVGVQLANRVAMGPSIDRPRFQWVPYDDALLFPLNTEQLAAATPDKGQFFPLEAKVLQRYLQAVRLEVIPATLDDYVRLVVVPTLQAQRMGGAVAIKFEAAYLRAFHFGIPSRDVAARIYAQDGYKYTPRDSDYAVVQDYLFWRICMEAGRLGMAVHLHTGEGAGSYFGLAGVNPMLLEPTFNNPDLRGTSFVMLHGSWPYVHEAGALLQKPNVYLDLSQQAILFSPRTMSTWLREWLELYPDKVLYGTDGYPYSESLGWEESLWIANRTEREALGLALTGMLRDGEIDLPRAKAIAEMVLRGNAAKLYGMP